MDDDKLDLIPTNLVGDKIDDVDDDMAIDNNMLPNLAEVRRTQQLSQKTRYALTRIMPKAIDRLSEIIYTSQNERAVLKAIEILFDRVYGKATPSDASGESDSSNSSHKIELIGELKKWGK